MSITNFYPYIPTVTRAEGNQTASSSWQGRFNYIVNTAAMNVTIALTSIPSGDGELIIRNASTSTDNITAILSGFTPDVSDDLGLIIPPGGIGEFKRLGSSTTLSFYGYIEG